MSQCSIAVDIGGSSGRVIAGFLCNGKIELNEVYRFDNKLLIKGEQFCWNIELLFNEIKKGIHECVKQGFEPISIGIDTWAVDFVLLDENDQLLTDAVAYRDPRTDGMMKEVFQFINKERLYLDTGIQFQKFNTIYQLYSIKRSNPEILEKAKSFLMIPDYFNYLLTGRKTNEYTNATTTQLVNAVTKEWDKELLRKLGINDEIFETISPPKTILGTLKEELVSEFGFDLNVILPATHDTGSAVIAVPTVGETIFISSGTWSLIGVENNSPVRITKAMEYNFTNEGGIDYRFRFLKNIMGLWMIQEVKRNYHHQYSFSDLAVLASRVHFDSIVNVDDDRFLKPDNIIEEIQKYCAETNQSIPSSPGEITKCVYNSLVHSYQVAIEQIEEIYEKEFKTIHIIGGGSQNDMLNQLITDRINKQVYSGPVEATTIGNLVAQFITLGQLKDIQEARKVIKNSFTVKKYEAGGISI